jgi:hypothetical protein
VTYEKKSISRILFLLILFLAILLLLIYGFRDNFSLESATPTLSPKEEWVVQWLNSPSCLPPCWENITPSKTTLDETTVILENLSTVIAVKVEPMVFSSTRWTEIHWDFIGTYDGGIAKTDEGGKYISTVNLYLNSDLAVQDVFSTYGPPNYVNVYACDHGGCVAQLVYNNIGMALELLLQDIGETESKVEISPTISILSIHFFSPRTDYYANPVGTNKSTIITDLREWEGFGEYTRVER